MSKVDGKIPFFGVFTGVRDLLAFSISLIVKEEFLEDDYKTKSNERQRTKSDQRWCQYLIKDLMKGKKEYNRHVTNFFAFSRQVWATQFFQFSRGQIQVA
jgi:hypothetical protein